MSIETVSFSPEATVILIRFYLNKRFPGVSFLVQLDSARSDRQLSTMRVSWSGGPSRDTVESALKRFQSLDWDPKSGRLDRLDHFEVDRRGLLKNFKYGVDYILCDGPYSLRA